MAARERAPTPPAVSPLAAPPTPPAATQRRGRRRLHGPSLHHHRTRRPPLPGGGSCARVAFIGFGAHLALRPSRAAAVRLHLASLGCLALLLAAMGADRLA